MTADITRRVRTWLVEASADANSVPHDGPCGTERFAAPCGNSDLAPYLPAERIDNGDVLCHRCGNRFRPDEPTLCGRGVVA